MEIINHGNLVKTCDNCGCSFKYNKDDVKQRTISEREDVGFILPHYQYIDYTTEYVCCPDCGNKIKICTYRKR